MFIFDSMPNPCWSVKDTHRKLHGEVAEWLRNAYEAYDLVGQVREPKCGDVRIVKCSQQVDGNSCGACTLIIRSYDTTPFPPSLSPHTTQLTGATCAHTVLLAFARCLAEGYAPFGIADLQWRERIAVELILKRPKLIASM